MLDKDKASKKYLDDSKKRFITILERKMKTTFIGALSEFERKFGFLWDDANYVGTMKHDGKFDKEVWEKIWLEARDRILTNGNNQLKGLLAELENYTLNWERYRINFKADENGFLKREDRGNV